MGEKLLWGALGGALVYMYFKSQPQPQYYAPGYTGPTQGTLIQLPGGWTIGLPASASIGFTAEQQQYSTQGASPYANQQQNPSTQPW